MLELNEINNPFPGIRPFEMDETNLFFGRDGQNDELLKRMQRSRFLAVVGTSGSGKSSLIRAGLLPALYGGLMGNAGSSWRIAIHRPGGDPIGNLALAMADPLVFGSEGNSEIQTALIEATLRRSSIGLIDVARQARMSEHENLLVVVDQFEELFRFKKSQSNDDATTFVKLLLEASAQQEIPIYIIITMRSDFLGDCSQFTGLPEAINDGQYLIPRMSRDERQSAITGPIAVGEGAISAPLVSRLLNDVGDSPDQLPILQHALMRTWDYWSAHRRNGAPIGIADYTAIGTMAEALSRHADEAFNELNERNQLIAEKLFKRLTEKGADNREIRRPAPLAELCAVCEASEAEVKTIIDVFRREGRSFLMPPARTKLTTESVIDISHESLIRNWTRLQQWVDEEAQSSRTYRRLAEATVLHREGSEGLLQDPGLQIALDWFEKNKPNAAWAKRYHPEFDEATKYLTDSCEAREAAERERERHRNAELERERREKVQAEIYAAQQQATARRLRWLSVGMAVMFVLALATAAYAMVARKRAKDSEATAVRLKAQAETLQGAADEQRVFAEKARDEANQNAEKLKKEKENADQLNDKLLAEQDKTNAALDQAKKAVLAAQLAQSRFKVAAEVADQNAQETQKAVDRGVLTRQAMEEYRREEYDSALAKFEDLRDRLEKLEPKLVAAGAREGLPEQDRQYVRDLSWTHSNIGATNLATTDFHGAADAYKKALTELESLPKDDKVRTDRQLFDIYHGLGQANMSAKSRVQERNNQALADAEMYFIKALEFQKARAAEMRKELERKGDDSALVARAQKKAEEIGESYRDLALLYRYIGKPAEAENYFKLTADQMEKAYANSVGLVDSKQSKKAIMGALKELAEFYFEGDRFKEAADAYNRLINIQDRDVSVEETHDLSDTYSDLARVLSASKDSVKANLAFKVASLLPQIQLIYGKHKIASDDGPLEKDLTLKLDQLGDTYVQLDREDQAKETFELARDIRADSTITPSETWRSYEKLGDMYYDRVTDKTSAQKLTKEQYAEAYKQATDNYYMLVGSFQPPPRDRVLKIKYGDGLERLGRLYALDPETYSGAEERLTSALTVRRELSDWKGGDSTYTALIDLYQSQKKEAKVQDAYRERMTSLEKYMKVFDATRAPNTPPGPTASTGFLGTYVHTVTEVTDFYLSRKMNTEAEAAYEQALSHATLIRGRTFDHKALETFAASLEKYEKLLRDANKSTAAVRAAINSVHEKIESEKTRQQQQQVSQGQQAP